MIDERRMLLRVNTEHMYPSAVFGPTVVVVFVMITAYKFAFFAFFVLLWLFLFPSSIYNLL